MGPIVLVHVTRGLVSSRVTLVLRSAEILHPTDCTVDKVLYEFNYTFANFHIKPLLCYMYMKFFMYLTLLQAMQITSYQLKLYTIIMHACMWHADYSSAGSSSLGGGGGGGGGGNRLIGLRDLRGEGGYRAVA